MNYFYENKINTKVVKAYDFAEISENLAKYRLENI